MIYTEQTKKAMRIAFDAHKEQTDKTGMPYIFHPFHLAEQMTDEVSVSAALLHDVVEDTAITFEDILAQGISSNVITALKLLTHTDDVPYFEYVQRIKDSRNETAIAVKLADLRHNLDATRVEIIDEKMKERWEKYRAAIVLLGGNVGYYQDDDTGAVIRFSGVRDFEIYRANEKRWELLPPDNSYMREVFIGQGNNCLTVISKEVAEKVVGSSI